MPSSADAREWCAFPRAARPASTFYGPRRPEKDGSRPGSAQGHAGPVYPPSPPPHGPSNHRSVQRNRTCCKTALKFLCSSPPPIELRGSLSTGSGSERVSFRAVGSAS